MRIETPCIFSLVVCSSADHYFPNITQSMVKQPFKTRGVNKSHYTNRHIKSPMQHSSAKYYYLIMLNFYNKHFCLSLPRLKKQNRTGLFQFLVLSIHQCFPMFKELRFRFLDILQCAFSLNGTILHCNDLEKSSFYSSQKWAFLQHPLIVAFVTQEFN